MGSYGLHVQTFTWLMASVYELCGHSRADSKNLAGFLPIPRKGIFQDSDSYGLCDGDLRQLLDDRIDVDGFRCLLS